jgi:hypothetical protein
MGFDWVSGFEQLLQHNITFVVKGAFRGLTLMNVFRF